MKDRRNELCDLLEEADILRNLPEKLPEMEDEAAAKRIRERVKREIEIDTALEKRSRRKRLLAAVICCLAVIGTFGHKPILAAFQRLFYDLPGVGVYIDEENKKIYEVEIDPPVLEQDGVRVELRNFYAVGSRFYGEVCITGDLLAFDSREEWDKGDEFDLLEEKYGITWFYGEKQRKMIDGSRGMHARNTEDGKYICTSYRVDCEEYLYLEDKGIDTYYLQVKGFDERFRLKVTEPQKTDSIKELGDFQIIEGTTILARAYLTEQGIEVEQFTIPSAEVERVLKNRYRFDMAMVPYHFDWENRSMVLDKAGEELPMEKWQEMKNGILYTVKGTEAEFPLTLHVPPRTGADTESHTITLALPQDGEQITEGLPQIAFRYGTVELLSLERKNTTIKEDAAAEKATAAVTIRYRVLPNNQNGREMYRIALDVEEDTYGRNGINIGLDYLEDGWEIHLADTEAEEMRLTFHTPSYWIEGDYDILIEKPTPKA